MLKFIKNKKQIALAMTFSLILATNPALIHAVQSEKYEKKVIVTFKENVTNGSAKKAELKKNGKVQREYKNIDSVEAKLTDTEIKKLKIDPNVLSVEEDIKVTIKADYFDWGVTAISGEKAVASGYTGKGVKVAVIDTGVATHPDLEIIGGYSAVDYTTSYEDDNGHGTHVAGIIGAKRNGFGTVGVAPDSSIYAVKAMDSNGIGYLSDIIEAIDWSITNKMNIINLSLGTQQGSTAFESAVTKAYKSNILVVAAAGNDGNAVPTKIENTIDYPAKYSNAIAVGAIDINRVRASFSSSGSQLEICAPGVNIVSTYIGGQYAQMSGTSMATPYVAGDIALLRQAFPTYTALQLRTRMQQKAYDLGTRSRDTLYGYGMVVAPY